MGNEFKHIQAWRIDPLRIVADVLIHWPYLRYIANKTTTSLCLDYAEGARQDIECDIRNGAFFITNHRDIVMDSAWLSLLVEKRYGIRPFIGIGNNLFGKWWIEPFVRINRAFVVIRDGSPRELLQNSLTLSKYIMHLREKRHSIWLAQREGRAKDGNDLTQHAVLKMLAMSSKDFLEAVRKLNFCPVSINYEYDPCDYLKAQEMQLKRDIEGWKKSKEDDLLSMRTGIYGKKGRVVFRLTPSINRWLDLHESELRTLTRNEQIESIANQIDYQIHSNYEIYDRGTEFEQYLQQQCDKIKIKNKDIDFLMGKLHEMYNNPVKNYEKSHFSGVL